MKTSRLTSILIGTLIVSVLCMSCTKEEKCPEPSVVSIDYNGPIYSGWPLQLEASIRNTAYLYKWSGPNGWARNYEVFSSDAWQQPRGNVTAADAGEYKLQLIDHLGCVAYEGSAIIEVAPVPQPSCTVAANTSVSSVAGVGDYSFLYRNFGGSSSFYLASGSQVVPGGDYMRFAFLGYDPPVPGVYKTSGFFSSGPDRAGLYIETITYQFVANPDQEVYVHKVNNKLEITICSVKFNNPISPSNPIVVSAKLTQP